MVKKKLIIFDLDGVLINSKKNMENSWNFIKKEHNLKHSFNEYYKFIGLPFQEILKKLSIKKKIDLILKIVILMHQFYFLINL